MFSVRQIILIFSPLFLFIAATAVGFGLNYILTRDVLADRLRHLETAAELKRVAINEFFDHIEENALTQARIVGMGLKTSLDVLIESDSSSQEAQYARTSIISQLAQTISTHPSVASIHLITPEQILLVTEQQNIAEHTGVADEHSHDHSHHAPTADVPVLEGSHHHTGQPTSFIFNSEYIAAMVKSAVDVSDVPLYSPLTDSHTIVHNLSQESAFYTLNLTVPVLHDGAKIFLTYEITLDALERLLANREGLGVSGETYLVGADGLMRSQSRFIDASTVLQTRVETPNHHACLNTQTLAGNDAVFPDYRGVAVLGTWAHIDRLNWCLLSEIDESEALASVISMRWWLAIFMILGSLFLICGSYVIAGLVSRPLKALVKSVDRIRKKDYRKIGSLGKLKEVTALVDSFNQLTLALRQTDERVNAQVQEQTRELTSANTELLQFKTAVDNAYDCITILDTSQRVLYMNASMQNQTGYSLKEVFLQPIGILWHAPMEPSRMQELHETLLSTKQPLVWESKSITRSGTQFLSQIHATPILDSEGAIIFYLYVERDISEEKKKEQLKNDFLSIASHELRTPMTVIKGYTELLLKGTLGDISPKQETYLKRMYENTNSLLHLVNDMLDLKKIEAGKFTVTSSEVAVDALLADRHQYFLSLAKENNVALNLILPTHLPSVQTDAEAVKRIINNFISNALRFTKQGSIDIEASINNKEPQSLQIIVRDTGIGIPTNKQEMLFKKFSQVDNSLQRAHEGTGLGLTISKALVEQLGGEIVFHSQEGEGSTFGFTLPIRTQ